MFEKNSKKEERADQAQTKHLEEENKTLYAQLTNKNQDYFFQLDSRLDELSYEENKKVVVLNQLLKETIDIQKDAITARRRYGTVTEQANKIVEFGLDDRHEKNNMSPTSHLYLDGALLLGGLFNLINGVIALRTPSEAISLFQLILNFVLGGFVVLVLLKYRPESGKTKDIFKYSMATIMAMLMWVFVMEFVDLIVPVMINPRISVPWVLGIGAVGVLARWYLKKELNIKGSLF